MNNLWTYCWLIAARISASEKDLPYDNVNFDPKKTESDAFPALHY